MVFLFDRNLNINTAGLFILSHLPHAFKWVIVPFLERIKHSDYRQLLLKVCLVLKSIILICFAFAPDNMNLWFVILTILHLIAALYDSVLLVSQVAGLSRQNWGFGEAAAVSGFRMGLLVGGAGALFISTLYSWRLVYLLGAAFILLPYVILQITKVNLSPKQSVLNTSYFEYLKKSWNTLGNTKHVCWLIALMLLFRVQDGLQGKYPAVYFMSLGYDKTFLSMGYKVFGIVMTVIGGFFAAWIIRHYKVTLALQLGLVTHALSSLGFVIMHEGHSKTSLMVTVGFYELTKGLAMTPFFSKQIMSCNQNYAMVQLAFLTSVASLSSTVFGSLAGELIDTVGWQWFWVIGLFVNIPAFFLINKVK
jgi:PAT family beta-lactamase induction signal transducer AmpG